MRTLHTHGIMIFGAINGKSFQKIYFLRNAKKTCKPKSLFKLSATKPTCVNNVNSGTAN